MPRVGETVFVTTSDECEDIKGEVLEVRHYPGDSKTTVYVEACKDDVMAIITKGLKGEKG